VFAIWLMAWFVVDAVSYIRGLLVYSNLTNQTGFPRHFFVFVA
jgi:hypothetical protein